MLNKPRIFISAVSCEFETEREKVAATLKTFKCKVDYQPEFTTGYEKVREILK